MAKIIIPATMTSRLIFAAAALAAATCFAAPAGAYAWREAPWCAVIDYGDGGVTWDCNYRTVEACVPNVLAGNRGTCSPNPAGAGPDTPMATAYHKHRQRHAQH